MLKKNPRQDRQDDLFRPRLENIIYPRHELVKLGALIDWDGLEAGLSRFYCAGTGRPAGSIRLMIGLYFLKDIKGLSDEEVCAVWCENPYFQHFCGETYFQHRFPVEPPSLSIFRGRIGEDGMERLLGETIKVGLQSGVISKGDMSHVTVDTTVQEKAVHFPTDVRLCHRAREALVRLAKEQNIPLRQSCRRKSKQAQFMANLYMAARQMKRARKKIKEARNYLGRVMRNIKSAVERGRCYRPLLRKPLAKQRSFITRP